MHNGRVCPDGARLAFCGILPGSQVNVAVRARGGGGDGGSTGAESRSSFLEMYAQKKPDKVYMCRSRAPDVLVVQADTLWLPWQVLS